MRKSKYHTTRSNQEFILALNREIKRLMLELDRLEQLREDEPSQYQKGELSKLQQGVAKQIGVLSGYKISIL